MKVFVAEITAAIDATGATKTFYVTNGDGFTTRPTDMPANTPVRPCLLNPGSYRREMFSGNRTFGAVRPAFGEAVLFNGDGVFDAWREYGFDGRAFTLRWGEQGAAYPADFTTVFVATMEGAVMDYTEVRLRLRDDLQLLEKPVLNATFAGTGGIEGPAALAGESKQRLLGQVGYPPPQLINETAQTYLISAGRCGGGFSVWDQGIELSGGTAASIAELLASAPAPGEYQVYSGGPTVMRLGSNPAGDLRVSTTGLQASGAAWTLAAFLAEAGFTGTVTGTLDPVGHLVESAGTSYLDILTQNAARLGSYFGFNRLGVFEAKAFAVPSGAPSYTFTRQNTLSFVRSPPDGAPVPAYKVSINAGRAWPSQLAKGASVTRTTFSRAPWYASYSYANDAIRLKHPSAEAITLDVQPLMGNAAWVALRDKYVDWFFKARDQVAVSSLLSAETLALDIGDVVCVQVPRFGYDAGKLFKIVAVRYDTAAGKVDHVLWG
ncbi:hypothetical protein [Pseudoduganella albidiflava]|uniref:Tip attachment protein J domain-containing protein n=1 Tax=Pseudoduganella albidiflava TaxID=321983 RepID=A0A411X346_9BURK|nr:hypothetical protein [Pseudoduganella albidiflava]QBI03285.1 hypothetical protein EYF70_22495 [Pseudoduganella albidiflava]GGY68088.1 hypothetical protein GCM10007387_57840 [Pseudoduganella albidiflava]